MNVSSVLLHLEAILAQAKHTLKLLDVTTTYFPDLVNPEIRSTKNLILKIELAISRVNELSAKPQNTKYKR
jgi:hypothetical protein